MNEKVNVYQMIFIISQSGQSVTLITFLLPVCRKMFYEEHFENVVLQDKSLICQVVEVICKATNISGIGLHTYFIKHSLKSFITLLLIDTGQSESSVILQTRYANVTTLTRYHNLQGNGGETNKRVYSMTIATNL